MLQEKLLGLITLGEASTIEITRRAHAGQREGEVTQEVDRERAEIGSPPELERPVEGRERDSFNGQTRQCKCRR